MANSLMRLAMILCCWLALVAAAGTFGRTAAAQTADKPQSPKVEQLLDLLGDGDVQAWLKTQKAAPSPEAKPVSADSDVSFAAFFTRLRTHIGALIAAVPRLPDEVAIALRQIGEEMNSRGPLGIILLIAVFIGAGFAAQWLFWHLTRQWRAMTANQPLDTIRERLSAIAARFLLSMGHVLAFALGSIGGFLIFDWPPLMREVVLAYLLAVVIFRLARVVLEFFLSPANSQVFGSAERFRIVPLTSAAALFWSQRLSYAVGWFALGWVTLRLLGELGVSLPSRQLIAYGLGVVLLAIGSEAVWHRPAAVKTSDSRWQRLSPWLWSACFFALWILWVLGAMRMFWLVVVAVGLPFAASVARKAVNNVLRPAGATQDGTEIPGVIAAITERGIRACFILAAIVILAWAWQVDLMMMAANDSFAVRVVRGLLNGVVIALAADLIWHVGRTVIDMRIAETGHSGSPDSERVRQRARIRTLLPILRNVLFGTIAVVAVLMILSSLGVEIGPLIAGAGVVGVAIGFGAQTVVKDIISGVFYLLDDAFRVGEYIESGSYKGTVESFSLRSVKLRHHRGALFTIPFSELGTVRNLSRDWVIEKISMTVTYDSDIDKARKIVKKIGLELAQDPEFKASVIEPLKMQGIDSFGDSGIILRMKLKTKPGEQFGMKRRALMMIRSAFSENNIKLAFPTVQIAGSGEAEIAAAAQHALARQKAEPALAEP